MEHRHDEFPPLTPAQQAEAIQIAARLQAEASSVRDLLAAAEEAGIERRFLDEAVARVASKPSQAPVRVHRRAFDIAVVAVTAVVATVIALQFYEGLPILGLAVLLSFAFALIPFSKGRPRTQVRQLVFGAWLLLDVVFLAYMLTEGTLSRTWVWSEFLQSSAITLVVQVVVSILGVELARPIALLQERLDRRKSPSL